MALHPAPKHFPQSQLVRRKPSESGTAFIEFVLATGLIIVPMFFGIILVGLSLILANQVTEVCRDVGHMYAYSVDFSQSSSQTLVTSQLAQGLNMTPTGGKGVIYLSTITYVNGASCTGSGLQANSGSCPNINSYVVIKRISIGNTSIKSSSYAPSITPSIINSNGSIGSANYLTDTSVQANNFSSIITLTAGQYAYVSEMFQQPPGTSVGNGTYITGLWGLLGTNLITARSIF